MNAPESPTTLLIPIADIIQSPTNPRKHFDATKLDELALSIKAHGVLQPILVRKWDVGMANPSQQPMVEMMRRHEIVCGERRWRASQIAGMATIPAIVRELTDKEVLELQVVENLQREDVHALEEAEGYERLMKYHDYTADSLGEKIGKSRAYIYARIKLLALAPAARDLFFEGKLTASTALLIARIPGTTLQMQAAADITKPDWKGDVMAYRAAADHIQRVYTLDLEDATFKTDDAALVPKAGSCDACPKRSGNDLILFADIGDPDVCTDPACFKNKRETNFLRLKDIAQKSGREIVSGKEAEEALVSGRYSLEKFNLANLNDTCRDDPDQRSYRDILGKQAPAVTYVEDKRHGTLVEAVDTKLLAVALKKAGIAKPTGKTDRADRNHQREQAEREAKAKAGNLWRGQLFQAIRLKLGERFAGSTFDETDLRPIVMEVFRQLSENGGRGIGEVMQLWILDLSDVSDEATEIKMLTEFFATLTMPALWLFMTDLALIEDTWVAPWAFNSTSEPQPTLLLAQTARLGIDAEALREPPTATTKVQPKTAKTKAAKPAPTPSDAAHASDVSAQPATPAEEPKAAKKAKAKADPAPAMPANEAATPPKTSAMPAWPFPTGARL